MDAPPDIDAAAMDDAPCGLAVVDAGLRVVRVNRAFVAMLGPRASCTVGDDLARVDAVAPGVVTAVESVLRGSAHSVVVALPMLAGAAHTSAAPVCRVYPVRSGEALHAGLCLLPGEPAASDGEPLLAHLAHELRMPIATVLLWEQVVRAAGDDCESRRRALDGLREASLIQQRLIEDVVDVSRGMLGKLEIARDPIDLSQIAYEAVEAAALPAWQRCIGIDLRAEEPVYVRGDPLRMRQVVSNLISNALKFGVHKGTLEVVVERRGDSAILLVQDDGQGIAPELLPHIFRAFSQGGAAHGPLSGLGLGLTIVRQLIELHGGAVTASSAGQGQGATFAVDLPAI